MWSNPVQPYRFLAPLVRIIHQNLLIAPNPAWMLILDTQSLTTAPRTRLPVPLVTTNPCLGRPPVIPRHQVTTSTQKGLQTHLTVFQDFGLIRQDSLNVWRLVPATIQTVMHQPHRYLALLASTTQYLQQMDLPCA